MNTIEEIDYLERVKIMLRMEREELNFDMIYKMRTMDLSNCDELTIQFNFEMDMNIMEIREFHDKDSPYKKIVIDFNIFDFELKDLNILYNRLQYEAIHVKKLIFKGKYENELSKSSQYFVNENYEVLSNYISSNPIELKSFRLLYLYPNENYMKILNAFKNNTNIEQINVPVPYFLRKKLEYNDFLENKSLKIIIFYVSILYLSINEKEYIMKFMNDINIIMNSSVTLKVYDMHKRNGEYKYSTINEKSRERHINNLSYFLEKKNELYENSLQNGYKDVFLEQNNNINFIENDNILDYIHENKYDFISLLYNELIIVYIENIYKEMKNKEYCENIENMMYLMGCMIENKKIIHEIMKYIRKFNNYIIISSYNHENNINQDS
jgi:hypothetical protein